MSGVVAKGGAGITPPAGFAATAGAVGWEVGTATGLPGGGVCSGAGPRSASIETRSTGVFSCSTTTDPFATSLSRVAAGITPGSAGAAEAVGTAHAGVIGSAGCDRPAAASGVAGEVEVDVSAAGTAAAFTRGTAATRGRPSAAPGWICSATGSTDSLPASSRCGARGRSPVAVDPAWARKRAFVDSAHRSVAAGRAASVLDRLNIGKNFATFAET
jgi:hypothetical protein